MATQAEHEMFPTDMKRGVLHVSLALWSDWSQIAWLVEGCKSGNVESDRRWVWLGWMLVIRWMCGSTLVGLEVVWRKVLVW